MMFRVTRNALFAAVSAMLLALPCGDARAAFGLHTTTAFVDQALVVALAQSASSETRSPSAGLPALAIDLADDASPLRDNDDSPRVTFDDLPPGLADTGALPSQTSGGTGAAAIADHWETVPDDSLQAALPPELRTNLPRGPTFRWFRPPRVWL